MPTEVIRSIGSGGYYSTLQAWEDDAPANLVTDDKVWIGEVLASGIVYSVGSFGAPALTVSGITTDATRFVWLRAAPGASFKDNVNVRTNALRYNEANGAFIRITTPYAACIRVSSGYFRMTGLQIRAANTIDNYGYTFNGPGLIIEDCIFGAQYKGALSVATHTIAPTVRNTLIYSEDGGAGIVFNLNLQPYKGANLINCTFVRPSNLSPSVSAVNTDYGLGVVIDNCAFFNYSATNPITGQYPTLQTIRNCAIDGSSFGFTVGSGCLTGLTYADQFEAVTPAGSLDLRLKNGNSLANAGRDTSGFGVTTDITGVSRSGTYDIGAWETVSPTDNLTASGIATGAPSLGSPVVTPVNTLSASSVATGSPIFGSPTATYVLITRSLSAFDLTTPTPITGAPSMSGTVNLSASGVTTGAPSSVPPSAQIIVSLSILSLATGAPRFSSPVVGQNHSFTAFGFSTGAPVTGTPFGDNVSSLSANSLATGAPTTSPVVLGQRHNLLTNSLATNRPTLGPISIGQRHSLSASSVVTNRPVLGTPNLSITGHNLLAAGIAVPAPQISTPVFKQIQAFSAAPIATGRPAVGTVIFRQIHSFLASSLSGGVFQFTLPFLNRVIVEPPAERVVRLAATSRFAAVETSNRVFLVPEESRIVDI